MTAPETTAPGTTGPHTPYPYAAPASQALLTRAAAVTPGGVNSPVRAFRAVGGTPRFMASAKGPYLTDVDGREYVDLVCSWGPMILGHAHPDVLAAVQGAEVTLAVEGKAENAGKLMFSFDLAYAGVFRIVNVPKENLHPLIMIECPRLLFPFAREIIATSVRDGGFPPLMLDPVDFVGLYRQNLERQAAEAAATQVKPS